MREILGVLKYQDAKGRPQVRILYEESVIPIGTLNRHGIEFLIPVPKKKAPKNCPHCQSPMTRVDYDENEDEPSSTTYECGLLVLTEYADAEYVRCGK